MIYEFTRWIQISPSLQNTILIGQKVEGFRQSVQINIQISVISHAILAGTRINYLIA